MSVRALLHGTPVERSRRHLRAVPRQLRSACRRVSFWSAIVLPFVALSLFLSGLETTTETITFALTVVASAAALVGGRGYGR